MAVDFQPYDVDISEETLQEQQDNEYLVTEKDLEEGVEGKGLTCRPRDNSDRFWDCSVQTVNPNNPNRKNIIVPVDAVNDHTEEVETETRATRVAATTVNSTERESFEVSGTCRDSNNTGRGTFCELKIEDA